MTSNTALAAQTCIVGVVVTNKSNMGSFFPEAGNSNGSNAGMCSDVAGLLSTGSGDLFELSDRSNKTDPVVFSPLLALLVAILDLIVATTPILPFRACYVIILHSKTKLITLGNHKRNVQSSVELNT